MNNTSRGISLALAASVLVLGGCVSPGGMTGSQGGYGQGGYGQGGYGQEGYGQPSSGYPSQYGNRLQGTVEGVDSGYGRLLVFVDDPRSGREQQMEVRYDQRTRLIYQGRESAVEGLERGDVIRFDAQQSGGEIYARSIEVVRNVREGGYGGGYGNSDGYGNGYGNDYANGQGNDLRGSIDFVDPRAQVIRLAGAGAGYGSDVQLAYDARTTVEYQGRSYRAENLERGDQVRVQARRVGNNQWLAERIVVERSARR